ncbi:copper radical oxidase [Phaeosphaeriaceae sp. PMI808]|nr:copper radical oxidase [Phaeosphaeriaceae sp. PMI808]
MEHSRCFLYCSLLLACIPLPGFQVAGANVPGRQVPVLPVRLPEEWVYKGCYIDSGRQRTLSSARFASDTQSAESCIKFCKDRGYLLAGTGYSNECFCDNSIDSSSALTSFGCSTSCSGNINEVCGGSDRLSVYQHVKNLVVARQVPGNGTALKKQGWFPEGCYTDSVGSRTLASGGTVDGAMTNAKCQNACRSAGYILAGTEYSGECYCDNQIRNNGGPASDGEAKCNMLCNGNQTEACGGPDRLSLFRFYVGDEPTSPTTSSIPVATSSGAATSSAVPVPTGLPKGFEYKGCYVDGAGTRIMKYQQPDDQSMTVASCSNKCAALGYEIAGMEYSYQCFCDSLIRMGGKLASTESECSTNCAGNANQKCGGPDRLSIWSNQTTLKVIQPPKPLQNVTSWKYQGCITDEAAGGVRVFPWKLANQTGNSPAWCLGKCQEFGYMAAGMEYGEECYCGDLDGVEKTGSKAVAESECATACPGNPEAICGQGNRLTWYKWEGEPLYVWEYPKGIAAGRYEFLVGGPIIPLISQPGVNGKVSLLEKHGTGEGNSTGAFEFDPSLGSDITRAFRELQGVKTDIFCAAGLTMPDRVGRQINIGGWSLDSTFGVRIYWPDGSPGVTSKNNWQEDVNTLKLQRGRWYPTGMVMANGSILVVGGQDGSNGKPVPNMEILPQVGPVLEAQYLRDSDPYNLYPFLVVLPSGGIFIQYYNEARILDENTLNAIKILPKVPAAVNDPTGGRTYPYEGTQVLLPQYYPYTAPLELLICGGAARQPRFGLDNCVSTEPDVAQPQWTIERMPSRRVLSCMATLPDGTFLILNGAETGEAGFGLADDSNYNAVLYDPSKARHRRMSVMANTTIARMYHSEAVVMDDGRVLVSGSDPQDNGKHPQEHRLEVFLPPYLLAGAAQPKFELSERDWKWETDYAFTVTTSGGGNIRVSLLGSESSTHGSSMGARILFPRVSCAGKACTVTAPKGPYVAPVGWYRMFVLDGPTPSHATWVRIGGDPGKLGNWPNFDAFQPLPGLGSIRESKSASNATTGRKFRG